MSSENTVNSQIVDSVSAASTLLVARVRRSPSACWTW
jgi:hypothetical protein